MEPNTQLQPSLIAVTPRRPSLSPPFRWYPFVLFMLMLVFSSALLLKQSAQPQVFRLLPSATPTTLPASQAPKALTPDTLEWKGYRNQAFLYNFLYPPTYILHSPDNPDDVSRVALLYLYTKSDYQYRDRGPVRHISIQAHENSKQLSPMQWIKRWNASEPRATTVASQDALFVHTSGFSEGDNVVFAAPDGATMFEVSVSYYDNNDQIRKDFEHIVATFRFTTQ